MPPPFYENMLLKKILWKENAFTKFAISWLILIIWVFGKEVDSAGKMQ